MGVPKYRDLGAALAFRRAGAFRGGGYEVWADQGETLEAETLVTGRGYP